MSPKPSAEQYTALTIAGSDPSGGAGIQADLKTFQQYGVFGMSVITLLTAQNTQGVHAVRVLDDDFVGRQLDAVLNDIVPHAVKTGALGSPGIMRVIASRCKGASFPLVVDPVISSTDGTVFMNEDCREALVRELLPVTTLLTPNRREAELLSQMPISSLEDASAAAQKISALGPQAVLVKGGHLQGDADDVLYYRGKGRVLRGKRLSSSGTHGTGCTLSAAITAELARGGDLEAAVKQAKEFVARAIAGAFGLGKGTGPLNHFVPLN